MQNAFFRRNILQIAAAATISIFAVVLLVHATTTVGEDTTIGDALTVTGALTVDTPTLVVDATNNKLGIGTTTPWGLLTVGSSTPTHITSATGYRDAFFAGIVEIDGVTYLDGAVTAASTLTVTGAITSDSPTFVIDSTNNLIGLGTTTPWGLLTVGSSTPTHITSATGYRDAFFAGILEVDGVTYLDGATTIAGAATLSSTLGLTSDLTINTNKFTVTAASGNTAVAGTLTSQEFTQGGGILATTTANSAETLKIADMAAYNVFTFNQTGAPAITYTLPATSTWTTVIPTAGDFREWMFENASSTSVITFAAGTGIDLIAVTNADDVIDGSEFSRLTCYRQTDTDVTCIISELIHAD
ncbi:MAG: hypothetical protein HY813_03555 [Candidatus Portnoybacteria bacterium]|nr:hypothetical protein [Candidatus Portnoybacteria bacterium]